MDPTTGLTIKPGTSWPEVYTRARQLAPEAFDADRVRNLWGGDWRRNGQPAATVSPLDGTPIAGPPMLTPEEAAEALAGAVAEHQAWTGVDLEARKAQVRQAIEAIEAAREELALLLVWEIGKPYRQSLTSVDRTVSGVAWYLDNIDAMLEGRRSLPGPVSNIASWNYPLSVLVHAMLVQMLAGNAVLAKSPT
ncbi:MAG: aldehyde dehydrogenase family protein, partial [Acidimicrobiales bacterium]